MVIFTNIGVVVNENKDTNMIYTNQLIDIIKKRNFVPTIIKAETDCCSSDLIISVGGDGTFLTAAKFGAINNKPVVGINLGVLGFLTKIKKDEIESYIDRIIHNKYTLQRRTMLDISIIRDNHILFSKVALNDVVVSRESTSRGIRINSYIDDILLNNYLADGIIISTPTGSTAYSFSAGGPIVDTLAKVMILTPICPHSSSARSYVTTDEKNIKVTLDLKANQRAIVTVDGNENYNLFENDVVLIKKSSLFCTLIDFFEDNSKLIHN